MYIRVHPFAHPSGGLFDRIVEGQGLKLLQARTKPGVIVGPVGWYNLVG